MGNQLIALSSELAAPVAPDKSDVMKEAVVYHRDPTADVIIRIKFLIQGLRGLRVPKLWGFPLTLIVALTTVLRTTVLHCDKYQRHIPSSFCYYIKCFDDNVFNRKPVTFTIESEDDDVAQKFVQCLEKDIRKIYYRFIKYSKNKLMTYKKQGSPANAKGTRDGSACMKAHCEQM